MAWPTIIDVYPVGTSLDGARMFGPFEETWAGQLTLLAIDHPVETGRLAVLALTGVACGYFVREALQPSKPRARAKA